MSVQVRRRRETAAFLSTFVGAQGELLVDTTNNRVQVHDGTTPGGFPAARLADLPSSAAPLPVAQGGTGATTAKAARATLGLDAFTAVGDANYIVQAADRTIAITAALTAPRTLTLPAAANFNAGASLRFVDQAGGVSATNTLTVATAGSDTINGAANTVFRAPFTDFAIVTDGVAKWTYDVQGLARGGTGAMSANGALTNLGIIGRTAVADANYTVQASDRTVAVTALTAARTITLPAASAFAPGMALFVVDESGACSATNTLTVARTGSDTINGATSAVVGLAYGFIALASNGATKWTIIDQSTNTMAQQAASGVVITGGTINGTSLGAATPSTIAGTTITASGQIKGTGASNAFLAAAASPGYGWQSTGQGTDAKNWDCVSAGGGALTHRAVNDAYTLASNWLVVSRSGYSISSIVFSPGIDSTPIGQTTAAALKATTLEATTSLKLASYTVATLPAAGTAGRAVYCSNARVFNGAGTQEGAGAGTGGLVVDNGTAWKIAGTNITASA